MAEPITTADWSTPALPSPLADLEAVGAAFRELGEPLHLLLPPRGEDFTTINNLLREIIDRARKPLSADLTGDPLARAILRQWARQPWQEAHRAALVDRMLDLGCGEKEAAWARSMRRIDFASYEGWWRGLSRRGKTRANREWRGRLIEQFGDFELKHLTAMALDTAG